MRHHKAQYRLSAPFLQAVEPSQSYVLLDLNSDDVSSMSALQTRCGDKNVVVRNTDFYHAHFEDGHTAIGVIDRRGELVAQALIISQLKDTRIFNVLVDPVHRGRGLHCRMIKAWLDAACSEGMQTATALVRTENTRSIDNFVKAGMVVMATKPSPEQPQHLVHVMKMSLQSWQGMGMTYRP